MSPRQTQLLFAGFIVAYAAVVVVPEIVASPAPAQAGRVVAIAVAGGSLLGALFTASWVWSKKFRAVDNDVMRQTRRRGWAFTAAGIGFLVISLTKQLDRTFQLFLHAMLLGFMPIAFFVDPWVRRRFGGVGDAGTKRP